MRRPDSLPSLNMTGCSTGGCLVILLESNIFCQAEIGHDWKHVIGRPKDTEGLKDSFTLFMRLKFRD